jgi:thioredoxin-like negative regulator of GroEL
MMPIVDGLASEFSGRAAVEKLDADQQENVQLQADYGVRGHPSFVFLDADGEAVQTFLGPQDEETLRQALTAVAP